jgi:UDP-2-acetamido-2-deoxy-ribo-hexuluronate aminotransferase
MLMRYCLHLDAAQAILDWPALLSHWIQINEYHDCYIPAHVLVQLDDCESLGTLMDICHVAKTPSYFDCSDLSMLNEAMTHAAAQAIDAVIVSNSSYWNNAINLEDIRLEPSNHPVRFIDLKAQYHDLQSEMELCYDTLMNSSQFILGKAVEQFEQHLQDYTQAPYAITCGNGSDAILLALLAIDLQPGDEVIVPSFSFYATAEIPALLKAKLVFVDIHADTYLMDTDKLTQAITTSTKAIIPVSLYGQPADMQMINSIAEDASRRFGHEITVIEDAAQSFGATLGDERSCNLSKLATTSFFPAKPLGAYGDAGAVFTTDKDLAEKLIALRFHGQTGHYHHDYIGINGRCDALQCALLDVKLAHYPDEIIKRQLIAQHYDEALRELGLQPPVIKVDRTSVYAQYTLRVTHRDALRESLQALGIPTAVHYPTPLHLQPALKQYGYQAGDFPVAEQACLEVMSLPISAYLSETDQHRVIEGLAQSASLINSR